LARADFAEARSATVEDVIDWLRNHDVATWMALAVLLAVGEVLSLDLVLLMLAVGAAGGAAAAAIGAPGVAQILVALGVSLGMLAVVRPSVARRLHSGPELTTGHAALVGRRGVVVDPVDGTGGRIRLAGELWTARAYDDTATIQPGATVDVFEIDGATAIVYEVAPPTQDKRS
jgi:membrane protein implicated in regulation of membrane protease activity